MEKLFTVMPDANPDAIKIWLSGAKDLSVSEDGQLEAETALGPVKFTRPIAYQEIDGKRVAVAVEYHIQKPGIDTLEGRGASGQGSRGEPIGVKLRNTTRTNQGNGVRKSPASHYDLTVY